MNNFKKIMLSFLLSNIYAVSFCSSRHTIVVDENMPRNGIAFTIGSFGGFQLVQLTQAQMARLTQEHHQAIAAAHAPKATPPAAKNLDPNAAHSHYQLSTNQKPQK